MLLKLKNKEYLIVDEFKFKCSIGKKGLKLEKKEGDNCTPIGVFKIGKVYYRPDRVEKLDTILKTKKITKNMGWCDDPYNKNYNKEIILNKKNRGEKLFRKSSVYDILVVIEYNTKKVKPFKGSAIFIHLTKNYKPTQGCIALKKNDLLILLKLIAKQSKIKIC
ncbi:L,D-transpeptidase family protein [Candidatus Pelagibacter sp.]|nr:L,D-transpeptidase family protein [Candidatus Pelagibacter sp.]|tara:strand:+ start:161 stop:652 length:492 start_codon:yes stop_codon:yes gene_type:complete